MKEETKAYLLIHGAVIFFGFTAILGAWIKLNAFVLVWWRVLIAVLGLTFFTKGVYFLSTISKKDFWRYVLVGAIIAIHWSLFFLSIKLAGASICLICMATTSLFISLFEPLLLKQPFKYFDFVVAIFIIPGMILIAQRADTTKISGIVAGLSSASLAAVFSSLNKKYIHNNSIWYLSWIEMAAAWCTLSIAFGFVEIFNLANVNYRPSTIDWFYLILLGILCTTIAHALTLVALKHISAFAAGLVLNLEPVYGILLAVVFLNESSELHSNFYLGAGMILLSVLLYPWMKKKIDRTVTLG